MIQFAIVILFLAGTQQDQVTIDAPKQERIQNLSRITGPFVVTYQDIRVEGDTATYDQETKQLTAEGSLRFTRGEEHLEADHISFNMETKAGVLTNASGELGPGFFVTAEEAQRMEDGIYYLKNATITTCDGPRPGWTIALARAKVNTNRHVSARNSIFKLESVPLFYLPYLTVPTSNRDRSTGFLIPSFTATSTTKGTSLRESFFWAINRSADATFTGEYFSKRGPAGRVLFQAVPSDTSHITVDSLFAKDRKGQGGQSVRILAFGDLKQNLRGVADMNLVSSIVFRQVYEDGFNTISSPIEHELAFLTRNRPDASINAIYDRRVTFFADQPSVSLRKFPTFEISVPDRPLGRLPLYFSLDTGFSGVARRDAAIRGPTFVERYDLHPSLEIPLIRSAAFDWSQRLGVRETIYTHSLDHPQVVSKALNRLSVDYTSEFAGPQAERDFGRWRHVIEPSVAYRYVGGADRFRETIVVDDVDLVTNTNEVEYALTNRLFTTREIFSWRLAQKYFFDPTFGGAIVPGQRNVFAPLLDISGFAFADGRRRVSPIVSTMRLSTSAATSTDFQVDYDTRDHLFRSAGVIGGVNRGQWLGQISYFFTRRTTIQTPNNQLRTTLSYGNNLKPGLSGAFSLSYDVQRSLFQGAVAQVGYNTDCYGLIFEYRQFNIGVRNERSFGFAFSLKNLGSYGTIRRQERLF
ncbi:MAG TPA: putative LPS assembly protein LptD [Terriglobia bacterium]|nr:putative LPS assembly protein LptD [Terriglobia bacterium]